MDVKIRFTIKKDLNQLDWLYKQNYREVEVETDPKGMIEKFNKLIDDKNYKFISAVDGNKLVGFCSGIINQNIFEQQKSVLMVWDLRVDPEYRKKNIAKSIMKFVENYAKENNCYGVLLVCEKKNSGANKFYQKIGYDKLNGFIKGI